LLCLFLSAFVWFTYSNALRKYLWIKIVSVKQHRAGFSSDGELHELLLATERFARIYWVRLGIVTLYAHRQSHKNTIGESDWCTDMQAHWQTCTYTQTHRHTAMPIQRHP
jgi:hypothetical protein